MGKVVEWIKKMCMQKRYEKQTCLSRAIS